MDTAWFVTESEVQTLNLLFSVSLPLLNFTATRQERRGKIKLEVLQNQTIFSNVEIKQFYGTLGKRYA